MKTVFAALNAKYPHTNLAVRVVAAYARERGAGDIAIWERTINHRHGLLLRELAELAGDVVVFSCYIWNVGIIRALAADLRKVCPEAVLAAAGPEVSYHSEEFLARNPAFDYVVAGEGERAALELLRAIEAGERPPQRVVSTPPVDLDDLPFAYTDLPELSGRILYYESMRGCPFRCTYCLSGAPDTPERVRFRALDLVFADLKRFLEAGVRRVKLVDRTFNCDRERARAIWRWLREQDNGVTGFHFELAGELLDDETCALLATLRPGQVQFEIGVQSTNPETLAAIRRPADLDRLFGMARRLRQQRNIHLHLDLIAGLPHEDYASFARSFDAVYALGPDQFQPGFLKLLRGSAMEREAAGFGIVCREEAPYEVLRTGCLTFAELCRLHGVADLVELYYNSGRFSHLVAEICQSFAGPFVFYEALAAYYRACGHEAAPPSKVGYYEVLGGFMRKMGIPITERHQWLCRYDMALHEKPKRPPDWVAVDGLPPNRTRILAFLAEEGNLRRSLPQHVGREAKDIIRVAHVEVFPFNPATGTPGECALLFDYDRRDLAGRAHAEVIALEMRGEL